MTSFHGEHPTGWLFTRGNASVRMTVEDRPSGVLLMIYGPGTASASYDFPDMSALMDFATLQEQQLRQEGFELHAVAERRAAGADGRERRQDLQERRRR